MGNPHRWGIARGRGCCGSSKVKSISLWSQARAREETQSRVNLTLLNRSWACTRETWLVPKNLRARLVVGAMGTKYPERGAFESSGAGGARDGHLLTSTGGQIDATKRRDIYPANFSAQHTRPGVGNYESFVVCRAAPPPFWRMVGACTRWPGWLYETFVRPWAMGSGISSPKNLGK